MVHGGYKAFPSLGAAFDSASDRLGGADVAGHEIPIVLVVDDDVRSREALCGLLSSDGYEAVAVGSGAEALHVLAQRPVDAIISDVMMPGMDGFEFARRIRAQPELAHVPLVVTTGLHDRTSRLHALESGADDFLTKPLDAVELSVRIRNLVRLKRSRDALKRHNDQLTNLVAQRTRQVAKSEAFLRNTLDSLSAQIAIVNEHGVIVAVNRAWRDFHSLGGLRLPNAGVGTRHRDTYAHLLEAGDATLIAVDEGIERVANSEVDEFRWEYELPGPDGRSTEYLMRVTRFLGGGAPHVVISHADVSELRQAERALRESEVRHRTLLETSPDLVVELDPSGRIDYISRTLGAAELPDALGSSAFDWIGEADRPELVVAIATAMETGELVEFEMEAGPPEQRGVYQCRMSRSTGDAPRLIAFISDITARRRAERALAESERQLRHAQRMESIGTLAGGVAHDFNNLLSVIFSYADTLKEDLPAGGPAAEDLDQILEAARRASVLTRQLLAFSRKQILKTQTTTLTSIVENVKKMLRRLVREDVEVEFELDATPPSVSVDIGQIEQVLLNLVVNARDAMPTGGKVTVATGRRLIEEVPEAATSLVPGEYAVLSVSDTGHGMDEITQRRIFEPFYTTKGPDKGTGLGLSTVMGIVQQSGGSIEIQSAPGEGATFVVALPTVARAESGEVVAVVPPTPSRGGQARTVLVVEDEPLVRLALRRLLGDAGYTVLVANDGDDALERAANHDGQIDLLLTDVVMPGMDGITLAERLRAERSGLPVIMMTGYTDDPSARAQLGSSRSPLLEKPFSGQELLAAVASALGRARK